MDLKYLAGLFDGEGCFSIDRCQQKGNRIRYRLYASITLRQYNVLKQIQELVGGSIHQTRETTDKHARCFQWRVSGKEALRFAFVIKNEIQIKRPQAELAIKFQELKGENKNQPNSNERWTALEEMYEQMQTLNMKGPYASEEADDCDKSPWQLFQDGFRKE